MRNQPIRCLPTIRSRSSLKALKLLPDYSNHKKYQSLIIRIRKSTNNQATVNIHSVTMRSHGLRSCEMLLHDHHHHHHHVSHCTLCHCVQSFSDVSMYFINIYFHCVRVSKDPQKSWLSPTIAEAHCLL